MYDLESLTNDLKFYLIFKTLVLYLVHYLLLLILFQNSYQRILGKYFSAFNLNNPILISTAYPSEAFISQAQTEDGKIDTKHKRGISIVLKSTRIERNIGAIVSQYQKEEVHALLERQELEVVYWNLDPLDRDRGGDLLKRLLLEGTHSKYFLIKGLSIFYINGSSDDQDTLNIVSPTNILFKHNIDLSVYRFLWGRGKTPLAETIIESIELDGNVILNLDFNMISYFDNDYYNNFPF
jgi:hypothetical protein